MIPSEPLGLTSCQSDKRAQPMTHFDRFFARNRPNQEADLESRASFPCFPSSKLKDFNERETWKSKALKMIFLQRDKLVSKREPLRAGCIPRLPIFGWTQSQLTPLDWSRLFLQFFSKKRESSTEHSSRKHSEGVSSVSAHGSRENLTIVLRFDGAYS